MSAEWKTLDSQKGSLIIDLSEEEEAEEEEKEEEEAWTAIEETTLQIRS
jgi:hypothetical protein